MVDPNGSLFQTGRLCSKPCALVATSPSNLATDGWRPWARTSMLNASTALWVILHQPPHMPTHRHACMYIQTRAHTHTQAHAHTHTHTSKHTHTYTCAHMHACAHTQTQTRVQRPAWHSFTSFYTTVRSSQVWSGAAAYFVFWSGRGTGLNVCMYSFMGMEAQLDLWHKARRSLGGWKSKKRKRSLPSCLLP